MAVTRTQVVKFIRKGDRGEKGDQGAVLRGPQAWSDCATGYAFQAGGSGEAWKDVVMYKGQYYVCKKSHAKTASNYPGSTTDTNGGLWQLGDSIDLIATKILLATYALVDNLGVKAIEMKDAAGNILFQAKDGAVTCKTGTFDNVTIKGDISATSLNLIGTLTASSSAGNKVIINPRTPAISMINAKGKTVGQLSWGHSTDPESSAALQLTGNKSGVSQQSNVLLNGYLMEYIGAGGSSKFHVSQETNGKLGVEFYNLPTSSSGLSSGMVYRDGSTLRIVP